MIRSSAYLLEGRTSDATPLRLPEDASAEPLADQATRSLAIMVTARQVGGTGGTVGDSATWCIWAQATRGTGPASVAIDAATSMATVLGIVSLGMGGSAMSPQISRGGGAAWRVTLAPDLAMGALALTVTGAAGRTVTWSARVQYLEAA